jgi:thiamine-monophosphate kinase
LKEFELIQRYFTSATEGRKDVALGIGDDCALLQVPAGQELAVSIDTLVAGVHFFADVDPQSLGHKALAVNLSDLAAMGAEPAWVTLALTLPKADEAWLRAFSRGFADMARRFDVQLVGGDTTQGPLTITVQVHGFVPSGKAMRRSGARRGDAVCVSGRLGDAGLALRHLYKGGSEVAGGETQKRLLLPEPRIEAGLVLRELANAAIDISDGLLADLGHILEASRLGARIELERLPLSEPVRQAVRQDGDWALPLISGDDYELCFTLPAQRLSELTAISERLQLPLTPIGIIEDEPGLRCLRGDGSLWTTTGTGYEHFSNEQS